MKITASLRNAYQQQVEGNIQLEKKVRALLQGLSKKEWHYEGRQKKIESFALKVESIWGGDPRSLEDFFACTLVVRNSSEIDEAIEKVCEKFEIQHQRPEKRDFTKKAPSSFIFDDLRLYLKIKKNPSLRPDPIDDIIFELQIKTYLQHAWTIATHDLTYKTDDISWPKARVAYQIKAMLEHAEVSIKEIDKIAASPELHKKNDEIQDLLSLKEILEELWLKEDLTENIIGLTKNIQTLLKALNLSPDQMKLMIVEATSNGKGVRIKDLPPYLIILQTVIEYRPDLIRKFFAQKRARAMIFVPSEINITSIKNVDETKIVRL
ncbi:hypothetical protein K8942_03065 [Candidatus Peribacteria bacterium]|nr:MAG: hypothetical protein K8942_03065 [Candidatus Peribacteria bacterium]